MVSTKCFYYFSFMWQAYKYLSKVISMDQSGPMRNIKFILNARGDNSVSSKQQLMYLYTAHIPILWFMAVNNSFLLLRGEIRNQLVMAPLAARISP